MTAMAAGQRSKETTAVGFCSALRRFLGAMTIEPVVACYMTAFTLVTLTVSNLNLQKACLVNLRLDDAVCDALVAKSASAIRDDEVAVQRLVANMMLWQTLAQNTLPCALMLLVGAWSDRTRRRVPFMLLPLYGELIRNAGQLLCVYYFRQLPMEAAGIAEAIPIALTGGQSMMTMTAYSYIGDATTAKHRTFRIGGVNVVMAISMVIGTSLSGIVYNKLGFYGAYGISSVLLVIGLVYGLFFVEDVAPITRMDEKNSWYKSVTEFFVMSHITQSLNTTFKKRPGKQRLKIIVLIVILMTSAGTSYGLRTVAYLYTRVRFNWNEVNYSIYATYELTLNITGLLITVFFLSKILNISDEIIGTMSTINQSLAGLFYFFASNAHLFYFGPLVNILASAENVSIKSLMTKLVPNTEISQMAAIFGVAEIMVSLVFGLIYSGLYELTLNTQPGAFYLVTFIFSALSIVLFLWMNYERKNDLRNLYDEDNPRLKSKNMYESNYGTIEKP